MNFSGNVGGRLSVNGPAAAFGAVGVSPDYEYGSVAFSRIEWGGGAFAFDIFPNIDAGDLITAAKVDGDPDSGIFNVASGASGLEMKFNVSAQGFGDVSLRKWRRILRARDNGMGDLLEHRRISRLTLPWRFRTEWRFGCLCGTTALWRRSRRFRSPRRPRRALRQWRSRLRQFGAGRANHSPRRPRGFRAFRHRGALFAPNFIVFCGVSGIICL